MRFCDRSYQNKTYGGKSKQSYHRPYVLLIIWGLVFKKNILWGHFSLYLTVPERDRKYHERERGEDVLQLYNLHSRCLGHQDIWV